MSAHTLYLKIKIKTLVEESRIIRSHERKAKARMQKMKAKGLPEEKVRSAKETLLALKYHRRGVVRSAARSNHLAYGFLRGIPYAEMEAKCRFGPDWSEVEKIAARFAGITPDRETVRSYQRRGLRGYESCYARWDEFDAKWAAWRAEADAHLAGQKKAA